MRNILYVSVLILLFSTSFIAKDLPKNHVKLNSQNIEKTLLVGLESGNLGLSISSAQTLGELKSSKAVIPLLRILHNSTNESSRIAAALSLYKIGDGRGIRAIKQAAKFDKSERVRNLCSKFYAEYKVKK